MSLTRRAWRGIDDEQRLDHAVVWIGDDGMRGFGTSITADYALAWRLDVGPGWITRQLSADVHALGWTRSLDLVRDDEGAWHATTEAQGAPDLPAPGIDDPAALADALDVDLGLCPVTNTMPVRRLGLLDSVVPETELVMAWIDVPTLRVVPSAQVYESSEPGRVRYRSADGSFESELVVDGDGLVVDYPHLARRVPA